MCGVRAITGSVRPLPNPSDMCPEGGGAGSCARGRGGARLRVRARAVPCACAVPCAGARVRVLARARARTCSPECVRACVRCRAAAHILRIRRLGICKVSAAPISGGLDRIPRVSVTSPPRLTAWQLPRCECRPDRARPGLNRWPYENRDSDRRAPTDQAVTPGSAGCPGFAGCGGADFARG